MIIICAGKKYQLPEEQEESYGRSFWSGVGSDQLTISEEEEEDVAKDRLDTMASKEGNKWSGGASLDK